jgi:hypothetical protein
MEGARASSKPTPATAGSSVGKRGLKVRTPHAIKKARHASDHKAGGSGSHKKATPLGKNQVARKLAKYGKKAPPKGSA